MTIISTPTELITAVPFLLNEQPENALLCIALRNGLVEVVLRTEIENVLHELEITREEDFFRQLRDAAPEELLILAYLPTKVDNQLVAQFSREINSRCEEVAPVKDFLLIKDNRWRSFHCADERCCHPSGELLPDIQSSAMAAEHVLQGFLMPSLSGSLSKSSVSESGELANHLLRSAEDEVARCEPALRSKRGVVTLLRFISAFTISKSIEDLPLAARALVAFTDIQVRDFAIGSHGDENLSLHLELWRDLLEIAPLGYRAPVATVLALLKYEHGDMASAQATLEVALCDDPHYSLAHLLQKSFAAGWPPEAFTTMRHELHPKLAAQLLD
jgi:hypothetical protein